jgi:hypothetical protein
VRPFRQYQELGLPTRITGFRRSADGTSIPTTSTNDIQRKEVVIENDIAWRINTLVDFVAGRPPAITSTAPDPELRAQLTTFINALLGFGPNQTTGLSLLQTLTLQGAIHGSAWIHLRPTPQLLAHLPPTAPGKDAPGAPADSGTGGLPPDTDTASPATPANRSAPAADMARWFALEVVDAARLCPLPQAANPACDCAMPQLAALLIDAPAPLPRPARAAGLLDRMKNWFVKPLVATAPEDFSFDLFSSTHWQRYVQGNLVEENANPLGIVPFIRYENAADPAAATRVGPAGSSIVNAGLGEVEPLIGLQDELNTRLSDRASRVTMTCFKMYLGRGIDGFTSRPIGPGQMWATDNPDATIDSFGGDSAMPSEDNHINEIREALDKISGVSPIAAGLIRGKLGNLTSAVALRLTLIALLARTERKRANLTQTLSTIVRIALNILDKANILHSSPEDRGIEVNWPTPLPESDFDRITEAQAKLALGVPREIILTELGYSELTLPAKAGDGIAGSARRPITPEPQSNQPAEPPKASPPIPNAPPTQAAA